MLTAWLLEAASGDHSRTWFEKFFDRVIRLYGRSVAWTIGSRWIVIGAFGLIVIAAGILLTRVGSEFLPRMDDGRVMVKVRLPTGSSVEQTNRVLSQMEAGLSGDPLIESMFTLVGGRLQGQYFYEVANEGELNLQLVPRHARKPSTDEYVKRIRPFVSQVQVPGGKAMVMPMKIKGLRQVGRGDIEVEIKGEDMNRIFALAQQVSGIISQSPHLANVYMATDLNKPEYKIQVDRTRAEEFKVSVGDVAGMLRTLVGGTVATRLRDGEYYYNIRLIVAGNRIRSNQDIDNLPLESGNGGYLRLRDLARTTPGTGPVEIVRKDQVKQVIVSADAAGASVGEALGELKKALAKLELPTGYEITFGGQAETMAQMQRDLLLVLAFAIFFAFVVLAVQWNSLRLPWIILVSLPGSLAGLVLALWVTGIPLGATVVIGILVVAAATINEGVLLLTFAEELRASQNSSPIVAVVEAAKIRLRPRLMITLMVIFGFIPLALNLEEGGDMLQPMAVGAIGGLALGIFVALFLMPCLYVIFTRERRTREQLGNR
jgi:multidrug efflux pump subunit AcrB